MMEMEKGKEIERGMYERLRGITREKGKKRGREKGEIGENDRWAQRREGCWVQHCGRAEHMTALQWAVCVCVCVSWLSYTSVSVCVGLCVCVHDSVRPGFFAQACVLGVCVCSRTCSCPCLGTMPVFT